MLADFTLLVLFVEDVWHLILGEPVGFVSEAIWPCFHDSIPGLVEFSLESSVCGDNSPLLVSY